MPFHITRSDIAKQDLRTTQCFRPALGKSVLEVQTYGDPARVAALPKDNDLILPYHWHWYQEEHFTVRSGCHSDNSGLSERFFRNVYQYLEDCRVQNISPSLPQLLLFLHSAEVSVAIGKGFPGWLERPLTWGLGVVVGRWFGGWMLGYRSSYPDYYDPGSREEGRKGK